MEHTIKFILWLIAIAINALLGAFVVTKLWAWFVIATFGIDPLRLPEAYGLSILVMFLTRESVDNNYKDPEYTKKSTAEKVIQNFVFRAVSCLVFLLFGWIASLFI